MLRKYKENGFLLLNSFPKKFIIEILHFVELIRWFDNAMYISSSIGAVFGVNLLEKERESGICADLYFPFNCPWLFSLPIILCEPL